MFLLLESFQLHSIVKTMGFFSPQKRMTSQFLEIESDQYLKIDK